MIAVRLPAAVLLAATAFAAFGAGDPAPLSLEQALAGASRRLPDRVLADTRGIPYGLVSPPRLELIQQRDAARIETMARYFDVILVDLDEAALSERMSTAYVAWNHLRERAPDSIETLREQVVYQDLLSRRNAARVKQRLARSALAMAMGTPGKLPGELLDPDLPREEMPAADAVGEPGIEDPARGERAGFRAHARVGAELEHDWLVRSERPRVRVRNALAARILDEARARFDAGESAELGSAMAATVEAQRDERGVDFAIALGRERLKALSAHPGTRSRP